MKAIILTGTFAAFIVIYSWVLVFSVVHRTQKRIEDAVAQEQASCEMRLSSLRAQLAPAAEEIPSEPTEEPSAAEPTQPVASAVENTTVTQPQAPVNPIAEQYQQVPFEAQAAARAKYVEGLNYFNQDDYATARQLWLVAVRLDPNNVEAQMGLSKVEELLKE